MTRRARNADTATAGRFPLRPGKPLVHRHRNGAWGWTCDCTTSSRQGQSYWGASYNCGSWQHALREALDHIAWNHKSPAQLEVEALEALYALPPTPTETSS